MLKQTQPMVLFAWEAKLKLEGSKKFRFDIIDWPKISIFVVIFPIFFSGKIVAFLMGRWCPRGYSQNDYKIWASSIFVMFEGKCFF